MTSLRATIPSSWPWVWQGGLCSLGCSELWTPLVTSSLCASPAPLSRALPDRSMDRVDAAQGAVAGWVPRLWPRRMPTLR